MKRPKIILKQSDANSPWAESFISIAETISGIEALRQTRRYTDGYSGCQVLLMSAMVGKSNTPNSWICKFGKRAELEAERRGHQISFDFVNQQNRLEIRDLYTNQIDGILIYAYAGATGRPPKELAECIAGAQSAEAIRGTVSAMKGWANGATRNPVDLWERVWGWISEKFHSIPSEIAATKNCALIYSPDFAQAYTNPVFHIKGPSGGGVIAEERQCTEGFVHGDLNLRNVLFANDIDQNIDLVRPMFIDFRHAQAQQLSVIDYAKLEATLRYQTIPELTTKELVDDAVALLRASRTQFKLTGAPEELKSKELQDIWRCIAEVRQGAVAAIGAEEGDTLAYWATLMCYAITYSTYENLDPTKRQIAYLDAAAILTEQLQWKARGGQQQAIVYVNESIGEEVRIVSQIPPDISQETRLPLLLKAVAEERLVVVLGGQFGYDDGVPDLWRTLRNIYKMIEKMEPPATLKPRVLTAILAKKATRSRLGSALQTLLRGSDKRLPWLSALNPIAVLSYHVSSAPWGEIISSGMDFARIETREHVAEHFDDILSGKRIYVPMFGDVQSLSDQLAFSTEDGFAREQVLYAVAEALGRRTGKIVLLYVGCGEWPTEDLLRVRELVASGTKAHVESYCLGAETDPNFEISALESVDVFPIFATATEIGVDAVRKAAQDTPEAGPVAKYWSDGSRAYGLENVEKTTAGMLRHFRDVGNTVGTYVDAEKCNFLLGDLLTTTAIEAEQVLRRQLLHKQLLPAIQQVFQHSDLSVRTVVVKGRAGAGVSALLCLAAYEIDRRGHAPVLVLGPGLRRRRVDWVRAGESIAGVYHEIKRSPYLVIDNLEWTLDDLENLVHAVISKGGELVIILGLRKDSADAVGTTNRFNVVQEIDVPDKLQDHEWELLARIVHRQGYMSSRSVSDIAARLKEVGILLPAIYEATDRKNRKFQEIVHYEYSRYKGENTIQRAYRFVCALGAWGLDISEFWLLKVLGDVGMRTAERILSSLSDDIVTEAYDANGDAGERWIRPRSRLIAEEVRKIATPDDSHYFLDIRMILQAANMSSSREAHVVTRLLDQKGAFVQWARQDAKNRMRLKELYESVLSAEPGGQVGTFLRQHYALQLRKDGELERALLVIRAALTLDPENPASLHISGLVYESRALAAWREARNPTDDGEARSQAATRARQFEKEAMEFFRLNREKQPSEEYGYEAEARYYKKKWAGQTSDQVDPDRSAELTGALWLLHIAASAVSGHKLRESAKTKAYLMKQIGNPLAALTIMRSEIDLEDDPVRRAILLRSYAALALQAERVDDAWDAVEQLIGVGEQSAGVYLLRDDIMERRGKEPAERIVALRPSAEHANARHVLTLCRMAKLQALVGDWSAASRLLHRADDWAQVDMSPRERESVISRFKAPDGKLFVGFVERVLRAGEGYIRIGKQKVAQRGADIYFNEGKESKGLRVGVAVEFEVVVRVRGFRAARVKVVG